jgi:TatD DNase family protein
MVKPDAQAAAFDFMRANIKQASAIGETGLDYWYKWVRKDEVERQKQKDSLNFHLDLARESDLPIVIHSRGAWRRLFEHGP